MIIITKKKQKELDIMAIKKLRFVARATLNTIIQTGTKPTEEEIAKAEDKAEQVFYADNIIYGYDNEQIIHQLINEINEKNKQ